jgi:hypothetical protein
MPAAGAAHLSAAVFFSGTVTHRKDRGLFPKTQT